MAHKTLIALGGAGGLWDELEQALDLCPTADIGAVNEAGKDYRGHLSLWATLHEEKFEKWQRHRKGNSDYLAVTHKGHPMPRIDRIVPERWSGSSGLYLVQVAVIELGYSRVICCGIPMSETPHYFDDKAWSVAHNYRRGWKRASESLELQGRVRSMSGWTRELLGHPTREWLAVPA